MRVRYSKLGREGVWGFAHYEDNSIELDLRLKGKKHLEILTHEALHLLNKEATEEEVERVSIELTNLLWKQGYRRIDNANELPLQNGKK